ncbi:MAG: serine/threonine protein kinase, partial [Phycisphaerae bacterium]|nr:serine/threonine protein kinase [Phycisphaerae bacterium]
MTDEIDPRERDVDWSAMAETFDPVQEDRESIVKNLRAIRQIARFNSLVISDQDPVETLYLGEGDPTIRDEALASEGAESDDPLEGGSWCHLKQLRLIGKGMHARIYRAVDPRLDREVALKVYRHEGDGFGQGSLAVGSRQSNDAVIREARLMARVKHPNVVTVFGAEKDADGRVGIWMDYLQGKTLSEVIREQSTLSARETELIGLDLCRALAAVHTAGIVHQDIKAQNVMREQGGRIVLMDFGVGRETAEEFAGQATGTPLYMAPEVLTTGEVSVASDIYSLGVLLFHLATGRFPVEANGLASLLEKHSTGQKHILRDLRPDLPRGFIDVVERALAADPKRRFASMGEMESALNSSLGNAEASPGLHRIKRDTLPTRWAWVLSMIAVVAIAATWLTTKLILDESPIRSVAVLPF